jgi:hypothetical protein
MTELYYIYLYTQPAVGHITCKSIYNLPYICIYINIYYSYLSCFLHIRNTLLCYCTGGYVSSARSIHGQRRSGLGVCLLHLRNTRCSTNRVTTASAQPYGNPGGRFVTSDPRRKIPYFCRSCPSVDDNVGLAPIPACPVPLDVWNSM